MTKVHLHRGGSDGGVTDEERDELDAFGSHFPKDILDHDQEKVASIDDLVIHNHRLAAAVALKNRGRGVALADLLQAAMIGIWKAARAYKPDMGWRFSSYASVAAMQEVRREIENNGSIIRIPSHLQQNITTRTDNATDATRAQAEQARNVMSLQMGTDFESNKFGGEPLSDDIGDFVVLEDNDAADEAMRQMDADEAHEQISRVLPLLTTREREVMDIRFGLSGQEPKSQARTAVEMGLTRERIRQLENNAMIKMRQALASEIAGER